MLFVVVETVHIMGGARAMPSPARVILAQGPSDCPQLCNRIFDTCHCIGLMLLRPSSFHTGGGVGPTGGVGRGCSACANQNLQRGSPPFERILASLSPVLSCHCLSPAIAISPAVSFPASYLIISSLLVCRVLPHPGSDFSRACTSLALSIIITNQTPLYGRRESHREHNIPKT